MIKMQYILDKSALNSRYLLLFKDDLSTMDTRWKDIKCKIRNRKNIRDINKIPDDIRKIITADFSSLVDMFLVYLSWKRLTKNIKKEITELFDYKRFQPRIAEFFMNPENGFQIHVCHYCGMAYINAFGIKNEYEDKLQFIKNAPPEELKKFIPHNLSDRTIKTIIDNRDNFTSLDDFDKLSCWHVAKKSDSIKFYSDNHFDLDHVLDKGSCPLLALSLYNFVPSCPVCNEKLKRSATLGDRFDRAELIKLSPTNDGYDFDRKVSFRVITKRLSTFGYLKNQEKYSVDIECREAAYEKSVKLFRLKQRYNYHKIFALRLLDLKERYSYGSIKMMSKLLQSKCKYHKRYTEQQIYEDIFGEDFSKIGHRCFDKLRRDILK